MTTVTGTIHNAKGAGIAVAVTFTPKFDHKVIGDAVVTKTEPTVTSAADGVFSIELVEGVYDVKAGESSFTIKVPDAGPVNINTIIRADHL